MRLEGLASGLTCPANLASYTPTVGTRERKITTQWHSTYRLPTQIDEPGKRTTFTHDANGNVLTRTELDTATSASRTWTYTYNSYGQVLTADGPRTDVSDVTTYTYYSCTTGYQCGQVHTITNAARPRHDLQHLQRARSAADDHRSERRRHDVDLRSAPALTSRTVGTEQTTTSSIGRPAC